MLTRGISCNQTKQFAFIWTLERDGTPVCTVPHGDQIESLLGKQAVLRTQLETLSCTQMLVVSRSTRNCCQGNSSVHDGQCHRTGGQSMPFEVLCWGRIVEGWVRLEHISLSTKPTLQEISKRSKYTKSSKNRFKLSLVFQHFSNVKINYFFVFFTSGLKMHTKCDNLWRIEAEWGRGVYFGDRRSCLNAWVSLFLAWLMNVEWVP